MKFRINQTQFGVLESFFKANDSSFTEIELEPVLGTAFQAIYEQQLKTQAFHEGYHTGFKEGYYEGSKRENRFCKCGCGGNNCHMRFCDEFCKYMNK